jgi:ERCC4-related helicase
VFQTSLPRRAAAFEVPGEVTAEVAAAERAALYATRPCLFVTTRILVVDQLSGRISGDQIAGMLVLNAHRWVRRRGAASGGGGGGGRARS